MNHLSTMPNTTSLRLLGAGILPEYEKSQWRFGGCLYQTYILDEFFDINKINDDKK
jgi:hypothetical protein